LKNLFCFFIILISNIFLCNAQTQENNGIEIFSKFPGSTGYFYSPDELISGRKISIHNIRITNKRYFNLIRKNTYNKTEKIKKVERESYSMVVLIREGNSIDTVSFGNYFDYIKINDNFYKYNWGLFFIVIQKLPYELKVAFDNGVALMFNEQEER
jgi:hypothetical protein